MPPATGRVSVHRCELEPAQRLAHTLEEVACVDRQDAQHDDQEAVGETDGALGGASSCLGVTRMSRTSQRNGQTA